MHIFSRNIAHESGGGIWTTHDKGMDYKTYYVIQRQEMMENKKKEEINTESTGQKTFFYFPRGRCWRKYSLSFSMPC